MCNENFNGVRTRILMKNICYAGVLAALLDLDLERIRELLAQTYAKKPQLVDSNMKAIQLGYDYAKANFTCPLPLHVRAAWTRPTGHIMIDGNTAAALGCVFAGATVAAWYPITPSTSLMDAFKAFCDRQRIDPETGRKNFAFIQAEDELAAIGMVIGAILERRARFHRHLRPGHFADERIPRPRLLRGGAGGAYSTSSASARRPECRLARSSATSWPPPMPRTATRGTCACIPPTRRSASTWRCRRSISPSGCRPRCWCCPTWTSA